MKKIIAVSTIFTCALLLFIAGCKKDLKPDHQETSSKLKSGSVNLANYLSEDNLSVSSYGFLIFNDVTDLDSFLNLALLSTHTQVQRYLTSIHFSSLGQTKYDTSRVGSDTVTIAEAIDYVLDANSIIQIKDVIIKPIDEVDCQKVKWRFLLAMLSSNLDNDSYQKLVDGAYDSNTMNKFATNPERDSETPLFDFMYNRNSGYEETDFNPCPTGEELAKPIFGWGPETCTDLGPVTDPMTGLPHDIYQRCQKHYFLWIHDKDDCYTAYGCGGPPHHPVR